MNSNRPNLFSYAAKELSQDAMICWLIAWAGQSDGGSSEDEELRRCGLRFVRALLHHQRDEMDSIDCVDKVEIHQQEQGIDVLARINGEHVLLIEDKTGTGDHSDQLSRYYKNVVEGHTKLGKVAEENLRPIYFKTGNQSLADERRIEEKGTLQGIHSRGRAKGPRRIQGWQRDPVRLPPLPERSGETNQQLHGMDRERQDILVGLGRILSTPGM